MSLPPIPFNKPFMTGRELDYIAEAHANGHLSGDGPFTKRCHSWLELRIGCRKALLTHSCTGALEMAAMLLDLQPGDEVIMPSFTFVSTANAFVLRGAIPVFVDIRADTLNIDETLIEAAITPRSRCAFPRRDTALFHLRRTAVWLPVAVGLAVCLYHGLRMGLRGAER